MFNPLRVHSVVTGSCCISLWLNAKLAAIVVPNGQYTVECNRPNRMQKLYYCRLLMMKLIHETVDSVGVQIWKSLCNYSFKCALCVLLYGTMENNVVQLG